MKHLTTFISAARRRWTWIFAVLIGLSFFCFVDDKYRGWDDTQQYQIEAKAWSQGQRPPLKVITSNDQGFPLEFPSYYPALVSFTWSFLADARDWPASMIRIRCLQALLIAVTFLIVFNLLGADLSGLVIATLFFANSFFRDSVSAPISEVQSLFLLAVSYAAPKAAGVAFVSEALTRPLVGVLFLQRLWEQRRSIVAIAGGVGTALVAILYFRELVLGSKMPNIGTSMSVVLPDLRLHLSELFFGPLVSHRSELFQWIWGCSLISVIALVIWRIARKPFLLLSIGVYLWVVFHVAPQGARYFLPLILLLLLEIRPRLPKRFVYCIPFIFLSIHLLLHQGIAAFHFRRDRVPETETPGLLSTKQWIQGSSQAVGNVMMKKFRFCINFFEIPCFNYPNDISRKSLEHEIRQKMINYVILSESSWISEENKVEQLLTEMFHERGLSLSDFKVSFEGVRVVDVRPLK